MHQLIRIAGGCLMAREWRDGREPREERQELMAGGRNILLFRSDPMDPNATEWSSGKDAIHTAYNQEVMVSARLQRLIGLIWKDLSLPSPGKGMVRVSGVAMGGRKR